LDTKYARGTSSYRPPELLTHSPSFTNKSDIWAFGTIFFELVFGRPAFHSDLATVAFYTDLDPHFFTRRLDKDNLKPEAPNSEPLGKRENDLKATISGLLGSYRCLPVDVLDGFILHILVRTLELGTWYRFSAKRAAKLLSLALRCYSTSGIILPRVSGV
jgi:serine/threonine protein kinase